MLCEHYDEAATWAGEGLSARGLPVERVTADDLADATRWSHRVGAAGTTFGVELDDGRVVDHETVLGTLNRLVTSPTSQLRAADPADRDYAAQELFAFSLSWLWSLPGPMLNRPTPQGLSGYWRHESEWAVLAARAGLRTAPYTMTSAESNGRWMLAEEAMDEDRVTTLFVVDGQVIGEPHHRAVTDGCRQLAALSGSTLVGIDLVDEQPFGGGGTGPERWTFLQASPLPELRLGGDALLDALAAVFTGSAGS